jgi:hypothetical protein
MAIRQQTTELRLFSTRERYSFDYFSDLLLVVLWELFLAWQLNTLELVDLWSLVYAIVKWSKMGTRQMWL